MESTQINPAYELTKQILVVLERGDPYRASLREFRQNTNATGLVDEIALDYEIVGLCQYPVYKEIRKIEPITISIQDGSLPQVYLREDFPTVPHLIVDRSGKQRSICYTDLSYNEITHKLNGRFLIECINEWFIKTARNELHREDQPLEPFFYGTSDIIIVNPQETDHHFLKFIELQQNDRLILKQVSDDSDGAEMKQYVIIKLSLPPSFDNIIHNPPATLLELLGRFDARQLSVQFMEELWSILKIRQNQNEFLRLFGANTTSLLCCPCIITLCIPQKRTSSGSIERSDFRVFLTEGRSFGEVLHDFGIERERKKGQKTNKLIATDVNNWGANIKIRQLSLHLASIAALARVYNNIDIDSQLRYTLIGAGALGSQLFANCIRSGFGKWIVVDKDIIFPHNLARHILTINSIGKSKATALEQYAKAILEDAEVSSVVADVLDTHSNDLSEAFNTADVIVDVSTSVAVERMLALDTESQARRISLFLNPCGSHLVMLCEDIERNVTLDLLEMQLYSILSTKQDYIDYFKLPQTIAYATSCRDITSRISQDNIALCAAVASKELKRVQTSKSASITTWTITEDGINVDRHDGEHWRSVYCGKWRVSIRESLLCVLLAKRIERQPNETGGVLIGQYDFSRKIIYIADMIFSPDDSIESPTSYIRGCENLPDQIHQIASLTYNNYSYIGEWHSHPGGCTAMSRLDERLLGTISLVNEAECLLGCMVICGAGGNFSVHIREGSVTFSSALKLSDAE